MIDYTRVADGNSAIRLVPNMLKLMDRGHYFIFDGSFKEVRELIKARNYRFTRPNTGELHVEWFLRLKREVLERRKELITEEFADMVNQEYFKLPSLTREQLIKLLVHVDVQ